jgi:hypothetical protein
MYTGAVCPDNIIQCKPFGSDISSLCNLPPPPPIRCIVVSCEISVFFFLFTDTLYFAVCLSLLALDFPLIPARTGYNFADRNTVPGSWGNAFTAPPKEISFTTGEILPNNENVFKSVSSLETGNNILGGPSNEKSEKNCIRINLNFAGIFVICILREI